MISISKSNPKDMKVLGGEYEYKIDDEYRYITDSGRSSLRLILKSISGGKKFLIPDFLCPIIVDILREHEIDFDFYHINEDLTIDRSGLINFDTYDILYIIDYFGNRDPVLAKINNQNLFVIEDAVFLPDFKKPANIKNWIGFNSFRKISYIADGSVIKSTVELSGNKIVNQEAPFVSLKYAAKDMKYDYIHKNLFSEDEYLKTSSQAQEIIDKQRQIYSVSKRSLFNIFEFYLDIEKENRARSENYRVLERLLYDKAIRINPDFYSFFVLLTGDRDRLRKYLFKKNIFLPVHWPAMARFKNSLCDRIISIPLDSRYSIGNMEKISYLIKAFYKK